MNSKPAFAAIRRPWRSPVRHSSTSPFGFHSLASHLASGLRVHAGTYLLELSVLTAAFGAAYLVRYGGHVPASYTGRRALFTAALLFAGYTFSTLLYRTYRIVWRFASVWDVMSLALTVATTVVIVGLAEMLAFRSDRPIPLSALVIGGTLGYLALGHIKLLPRVRNSVSWGTWGAPLLIYGAGSAGVALVRQLQAERGTFQPLAFLDDDRRKRGRDVLGLPVLGDRSDLQVVMKRTGAQNLALALPSAPQDTVRGLTRLGIDAGARVLVVPTLDKILADRTGRIALRDVAMEDLVGRPEVVVDTAALQSAFQGKRVLVTGAAGSIGSELVRQVRAFAPESVTMLDNNESGLADLRDALGPAGPSLALRVASVHDRPGIARIFNEMKPHVVLHAAALKHVDLVEVQPHEAVRVNVAGTWICAQEAERAGVQTFVLISTDKAVDPVGVLGATKRICELMVASLRDSPTLFAAVRFGNVIGSRGSVLPRFEEQIRQGGPLTVTHRDVRRYFMSVDEAVRLVLQCVAIAKPGRVYVLDMGEDLAIADIAARLARLHGLRVPEDIDIVYTGLRPGERLREALLGPGESIHPTTHSKVNELVGMESRPAQYWQEVIEGLVSSATTVDSDRVRQDLLAVVAAHSPSHALAGQRPCAN